MEEPIDIFIAYAQQDKDLLDRFRKQLSTAERIGLVDAWHDGEIEVGTNRADATRKAMESAEIIVLLLSADFLASEHLYEEEMMRALELSKAGKAAVLPVLLKECAWELTPLANLKMLPPNSIPVTDEHWKHPDRAFKKILNEIIKVSNKIRKKKGHNRITYQAAQKTNPKPELKEEQKEETPLWRLALYAFAGLGAIALLSFFVNKAFLNPNPKVPQGKLERVIPQEEKSKLKKKELSKNSPIKALSVQLNGIDWMIKNANLHTEESWCYKDNPDNCKKYGRLYSFEAAKKLCPEGWRLPTRKEWLELSPQQVEKLNLIQGGFQYREAYLQGGKVGYYRTSEFATGEEAWIIEFRGNTKPLVKNRRYAFSGISCRCVR